MNIPMSDEEKWAIYKDLLHIRTREDYPQPNITVQEYARLDGIDETTAANKLASLVKQGTMRKATNVKIGSNSCNIYWATSLEKTDTPQASNG